MIKTESVGGVVLNNEGKVLVVDQSGTSWSLPKGHVEEGEDKIETAQREIYEESGVQDLNLIRFLGKYKRYKIGEKGGEDKNELKTIHVYLFSSDQKDLKPVDPKNQEARWIDKDKVADLLTHPKDKEFFLKIVTEI